jgi:hypothetical protein
MAQGLERCFMAFSWFSLHSIADEIAQLLFNQHRWLVFRHDDSISPGPGSGGAKPHGHLLWHGNSDVQIAGRMVYTSAIMCQGEVLSNTR